MTIDDLRKDVCDDIADLRGSLAEVQANVAAIKAVTDAIGERRDGEARAMWGRHQDVDGRLRTVEISYAPKAELDKLTQRIGELEKQQARTMGWGMAGMFIVQLIGLGGIAALLKITGAH